MKLAALFLCLSTLCVAQNPEWKSSEIVDSFSDLNYTQFVLTGRFLNSPKDETIAPQLIVACKAREHSVGYHVYTGGDLLKSFLSIGSVINRDAYGVPAMYRIDGGNPQIEMWSISTDGMSAFFGSKTLNNLVFGHMLMHKVNTSEPTTKVVIAVDEAFGGKVVAEFDMPDPALLSETCGMVVHKR